MNRIAYLSNSRVCNFLSYLKKASATIVFLAILASHRAEAVDINDRIAKLEIARRMPNKTKEQYGQKLNRTRDALKGLEDEDLLTVYFRFNKGILRPDDPFYEGTYNWDVVRTVLDMLHGEAAMSRVIVHTPPTNMPGSICLGSYLHQRGFSRRTLLRCIQESKHTAAESILRQALKDYRMNPRASH